MRIIAGVNKGRLIRAPKWDGLRPTSDRLRETLFAILSPRVSGARVLDVYAGTGAIALEALSRGAASAVCIERDRRAAALIAENAGRLGESQRCMILRNDAVRALRGAVPGGPFDIVVLDPPYDADALETALAGAAAHLAPGGLIVLEHAFRRRPPDAPGLSLTRTVRAGDSALSFYA
jgi:16S rRNA (guanine966-N2)-methyltransferase